MSVVAAAAAVAVMPHAERLGRLPFGARRCFWSSIIRIRSLVKYLSTQVLTPPLGLKPLGFSSKRRKKILRQNHVVIVLQIKPFEIVCKHSSEQLQAAVALSRQALQLVRSQHRVIRLPFWMLDTVADVPWGIMTKTMANPCQAIKVLHSRRGCVVSLCECVRRVLRPFHRQNSDIPMAN